MSLHSRSRKPAPYCLRSAKNRRICHRAERHVDSDCQCRSRCGATNSSSAPSHSLQSIPVSAGAHVSRPNERKDSNAVAWNYSQAQRGVAARPAATRRASQSSAMVHTSSSPKCRSDGHLSISTATHKH